jgi:hypothetical protein
MSLTYTTYVSSLANLLPVSPSDPGFQTVFPNIIDDAEQRLYRELDLIDTSVRDSSAALSTGTRNFNIPSSLGTFIVTDEINIITPVGTSDPELGTRNALVPTSEEVLNFLWPSSTGSAVPQYFAMVNQGLIIVGPWPDQAYQVEAVGTIRPLPISTSNVTTLLSVFFPDLFIAASMVFAAAYQKNFGAAVDDPKSGVTWEGHLQALLTSAATEEARKKFTAAGWSSKEPAPLATPPRT